MQFKAILFLILLPAFVISQTLTNTTSITITKTWSQEPSGYTYPINIFVPIGVVPEGGFPVCITLHGNGGVGNVNAWRNTLPNHIIVAPSGYERSWNIADENSDAPDVEMINDLVDVLQTFSNVNPNKIRILGTSNGAGLANRVFLENKDLGIDIICAIVSHLTTAHYHNNGFYFPSGETGDNGTGIPAFEGYDTQTVPITGRRYLNISNNNDGLIPYTGGSSPVGVTFLDAQEASYIVAKSQGYTGAQVTTSTLIDGNVYEFEYLSGQVIHLNGDAMHATNTIQKEYVADYFNRVIGSVAPPPSSCETNLSLSTTVATGTYQVSNEITCNSAIANDANVIFQASKIILNAGFIVEAGTNFTAEITPCSALRQPNSDRSPIAPNLAKKVALPNARNTLSIYPNPTKAFLSIHGDFTKELDYSIHSLNGQELIGGQVSVDNQLINLGNLPANIYFLNVEHQTFKVIKID